MACPLVSPVKNCYKNPTTKNITTANHPSVRSMGEAVFITPVAKLEIEGVVFQPAFVPPGSSKSLFLAGAGERGLEINGKFVVFTAIGVYLEDAALQWLAGKWKGKNADELSASADFFRDVVTGPFEKSTRVAMVLPLTGQQYSEKVSENCVNAWKAAGVYTEAEAAAVDKFREALKAETFLPGSSILFKHSSAGSLTMIFSKEERSSTEAGSTVIESRLLSEAILESIIGEHGVSPSAKRSLATRIAGLLVEKQHHVEEDAKVENPAALATPAPGAVFTCTV